MLIKAVESEFKCLWNIWLLKINLLGMNFIRWYHNYIHNKHDVNRSKILGVINHCFNQTYVIFLTFVGMIECMFNTFIWYIISKVRLQHDNYQSSSESGNWTRNMVIQLDVIIFCRNYCYHTFSDNKVADIFSTHIFKATSQERFKYYSFFALQTYLTQNLSLIQKIVIIIMNAWTS